MRLKSLYINDYKNIKEQTFDFSDNTGYIALIGLNGSGKSNLLEAIAWANSIKKRIQKHKSENTLSQNDYNGFQAFLEQLMLSFKI